MTGTPTTISQATLSMTWPCSLLQTLPLTTGEQLSHYFIVIPISTVILSSRYIQKWETSLYNSVHDSLCPNSFDTFATCLLKFELHILLSLVIWCLIIVMCHPFAPLCLIRVGITTLAVTAIHQAGELRPAVVSVMYHYTYLVSATLAIHATHYRTAKHYLSLHLIHTVEEVLRTLKVKEYF